MKTGHIADLHHNAERNKRVLYVLDQLKELAPDLALITNSGENFHNPYTFTERSGFNDLLDAWEAITSLVPVATIRATQGRHERPGMVETLQRVSVKILEPGNHYGLTTTGRIVSQNEKEGFFATKENTVLQMFGVPHPHKAHILAGNKELSSEEANQAVNSAMRNLYTQYGAMRASLPSVPALAVGHGVVQGKNTRDLKAITSSAIYSTEADLASMGCDFYAWGHYHNPTDFDTVRGGYLGSFAWDFNECDYKPAITVFDWEKMEASRHELDINMRKVFSMNPGEELPDMTGLDVHLINNKTEWTEEDCKAKGAGTVRVTTEIEIERKIRSTDVMTAVTYTEKFKAVYPDATDEQLKVCEQFWNEDKASGRVPVEKQFELLSLEVRGSKALLERTGKEEATIDLSTHPEGLLMLLGPGGSGKSTLIDLASPFSVLFLQANTLLSTFELGDSYVKQHWRINGKEYRIEKLFKPTLKQPKAEYFAFDENGPISGLNGNRAPYDEWCVQMFGSPRKYSSFVLNTQFDDNPSKFMGQPINPSIFQATNIDLKNLFHELAGTDLKHLENRCRDEAKVAQGIEEEERAKKRGAEESLPDIEGIRIELSAARGRLEDDGSLVGALEADLAGVQKRVDEQRAIQEKNREATAVHSSILKDIEDEKAKKTGLDAELATLGNVDKKALQDEFSALETAKSAFDRAVSALPAVKSANSKIREEYRAAVSEREEENEEIRRYNADIDKQEAEKALWTEKRQSALMTIRAKQQAAKDTAANETARLKAEYDATVSRMTSERDAIKERIENGNALVATIVPCANCGFISDEDLSKKSKYTAAITGLRDELEKAESALVSLAVPGVVAAQEPDISIENAVVREADEKISGASNDKRDLLPPVEEPAYQSEDLPAFDSARHETLKATLATDCEERAAELSAKINECSKRIGELTAKAEAVVFQVVDDSVFMRFADAENDLRDATSKRDGTISDIRVLDSRIADAEKARESLAAYDKKIEEAHATWAFWNDMKCKWGPSGVPARILEHTGPYVDDLANEVLARHYPIYKVHSETTKPSADGKQELEVFTISVINQETGREKPINALSGEERQFVKIALRHAFRQLNKQNTLESWAIQWEDEPDSNVSETYLDAFWDMIEETCPRGVCISHSPVIKHRSQTSVDVTSL